MSAIRPLSEAERIPGLDLIRGIAILGIIPANLPSFILPVLAGDDAAFMSPHPSELFAEGIHQAFIAFKFITVFAILFGAGLALQEQRIQGPRASAFQLRRMAILALFGLTHAWALWYGDILFWYACTGCVALLCQQARPKVLVSLGLGLVLTSTAIWVLIAAVAEPGAAKALTLDAALADPELFQRHALSRFDPAWELDRMRNGSALEILQGRLANWLVMVLLFPIHGWRLLGLMLLGMALMKAEVFAKPERHRALLQTILIVGLGPGLSIELGRALIIVHEPSAALRYGLEAGHQLSSLALALAFIGLALRAARGRPSGLQMMLSAVGRMALTCYLLETLAGTLLCCPWGFGLAGQLTRVQIWLIAITIAGLLGPFSLIWLRSFKFGPAEWLWRSLSYGKWQPMRRDDTRGDQRDRLAAER